MNIQKVIGFTILTLLVLGGIIYLNHRNTDWNELLDTDIERILTNSQNSDQKVEIPDIQRSSEILKNRLFITISGNSIEQAEIHNRLLQELKSLSSIQSVFTGYPELLSPLTPWMQNLYRITFPQWYLHKYNAWTEITNNNPKSPESFHEWLSQDCLNNLNRFMQEDRAISLYPLIAQDPLLLHDSLIHQLKGMMPKFEGTAEVIILDIKPKKVDQALREINTVISIHSPTSGEISIHLTGYSKYENYSKNTISREVTIINILSLILVSLCILFFFRKLSVLWIILSVLILSILISCATIIILFGSIHVLVIGIGSLINGVAVDYAFHTFLRSKEGNKRMLRPLLQGFGTTFLAFISLTSLPFELFSELAFFVCIGLSVSLLLFLTLSKNIQVSNLAKKQRCTVIPRLPRTFAITIITLSFILPAFQLIRSPATWLDDIRQFNVDLTPVLQKDNLQTENLNQVSLYSFENTEDTFAIKSKIQDIQNRHHIFSIHQFLLDKNELQSFYKAYNSIPSFIDTLYKYLVKNGYDLEYFKSFQDEMKIIDSAIKNNQFNAIFNASAADLNTRVLNGLALPIYNTEQTILISPTPIPNPGSMGLTVLNQVEKFNHLVSLLRHKLIVMSITISIVILVMLLLLNRNFSGLKIITVPILTVLLTIFTISLIKGNLNLFHIVGLLIGSFIAVDYALFCFMEKNKTIPYSVTASATTSIAAFACLLFSTVPVVQALGLSAFLVVCFSIILIYLMQSAEI